MNQHYYLKRDQWSWRYKEQPGHAWSFFTDHETDIKSIKNYLSGQGRYDPPSVSFVTDDLRPANIFEIRRKGNYFDVIQNAGEKNFIMYDYDFIPIADIERYFHDRTTPEVIEKADRLQNLPKIKFYKDSADDHTLTEYKAMVKERMSDNAIRQRLADYEPGKVSEVYFPEDNIIPQRRGYHD